MAEKWKIQGTWMNSCSCDPGCPCLFWSDPTQGHCDAIDTFHIESGHYGKTKLDGLNFVMATKVPGNFWKGNWTAAVYLDKRATADQRKALETIVSGKAGGAPEMLAKMIAKVVGIKWVDITLDTKKHTAEIPGILSFDLDANVGGDQKKAITVGNHPFSPAIGPIAMAKGKYSTYTDYDMKFDNTGKDGNWAKFDFTG